MHQGIHLVVKFEKVTTHKDLKIIKIYSKITLCNILLKNFYGKIDA